MIQGLPGLFWGGVSPGEVQLMTQPFKTFQFYFTATRVFHSNFPKNTKYRYFKKNLDVLRPKIYFFGTEKRLEQEPDYKYV